MNTYKYIYMLTERQILLISIVETKFNFSLISPLQFALYIHSVTYDIFKCEGLLN